MQVLRQAWPEQAPRRVSARPAEPAWRPEPAWRLVPARPEPARCVPGEVAARSEWPAVPAWGLRAQHPASACQLQEAGLSGRAVQSALLPEPAFPDVPGAARRRAAAGSVPCAVWALEEAAWPDARARPPGAVASAGPLALRRVVAEVLPSALRREAAAEPLAQRQGAAAQALPVVAAERPRAAEAPQAFAVAAQRQAERAVPAALPSPAAASTCPQQVRRSVPAPARSARFAPATARS
jgi:hypothetical protein